ncbi:MAG: DNA polymerase I [Clostridiales Family XIII bacterium]|jgi:DNA polymerase-1|nr:DNA polymerase I [Clostridiales Family XIII bacterium]
MGETNQGEKIAIIDGNSLVFRAFFAIRNPMITSRGVYTHAIFGFLNMLSKALDDAKPDYITIAFDRKAPTFRHLEYDAYKAGRAKTPDELSMQLPYLKDILAAMHITILEMDGFEADDLIGTVAKRAEAAGMRPLVITGDRDELQLVSDRTSVLITKKGVSEFELNTPASMLEKYGFGPELFVDYKGLMGDASDNIPGLPGVGEKTAAKLVQQFGSIENIVRNLDKVAPERLRGIIEDNEMTAFMSKRLATIVTNVPIETDFEAMRVREWDLPRLRELYTELEFRSFLKKLPAFDGGENGKLCKNTAVFASEAEQSAKPSCKSDVLGLPRRCAPRNDGLSTNHAAGDGKNILGRRCAPRNDGLSTQPGASAILAFEPGNVEITRIDSVAALAMLKGRLARVEEIVLHTLGDYDHVEAPQVYAIYIMVNGEYFCVMTRDDEALLLAAAEMLVSLPLGLVGFCLKDDLYRLRRILALAGKLPEADAIRLKAVFDMGVAGYLIAPGGPEPSFAWLAQVHGGFTIREVPDFSQNILAFDSGDIAGYGRDFCVAALALLPVLRQRLEDAGMAKLFDEVEMPLAETLAETEANGFAYDGTVMDEIAAAIDVRIDELTRSITEAAGEAFNINSPKQLGVILFEKLGLPGGKKNKSAYSTGVDILSKLKDDYPIVGQVLEYRMIVKLKGTYIDGLPAFVAKDGKIRAHLLQTVTATGRLSCADPNLQNIPIRKEPGRQLRRAFVPECADCVLMGADYSQIELRVLAHLSGDPFLIEDFTSGADIHRRTAARVFGVENEGDVTPAQRSGAKAVNFGIIYGMSSFGLSEELAITRKDAERYIAEYFNKHKAVKEFMDSCVTKARRLGYATTILGRRRPIPEISASQYMVRQLGERIAMNSPVQGSAADIIKIAMNCVAASLKKEGLAATLILQVHDELILQVKKREVEQAARILKREMEGAAALRVPLEAEVKTGANWYELK